MPDYPALIMQDLMAYPKYYMLIVRLQVTTAALLPD